MRLPTRAFPSICGGPFENGDCGVDAARCALEYALKEEPATVGAAGEPIFFCGDTMRIMAPITPKEFFHTAGIFASTTTKHKKSAFPIRHYYGYLPGYGDYRSVRRNVHRCLLGRAPPPTRTVDPRGSRGRGASAAIRPVGAESAAPNFSSATVAN